MDPIVEVAARLKKKNLILFTKNSEFLEDLKLSLIGQNHRVLVLWALDLAAESVDKLEAKYPHEKSPREALSAARDWAAGRIKIGLARRKILACHAFAKRISDREDIATCHAIGQACSVVHTVGHAMGYPIYDLTSIVYKYGTADCANALRLRKQAYVDKLSYYSRHVGEYGEKWADFMLR